MQRQASLRSVESECVQHAPVVLLDTVKPCLSAPAVHGLKIATVVCVAANAQDVPATDIAHNTSNVRRKERLTSPR